MKNIGLILSIFLVFSCSNDFDLIEETKDIPIVYGVIDLLDTAQYIRVERAFVDPAISALELAMDPNNLYYDDIDVQLVSNGNTYDLIKVDGDLEGQPRREGIFAQSPNTLYKINTEDIPLEAGEAIQLSINRKDTFPLITANTVLVGEGRITNPSGTGSLDFDYTQPTTLKWIAGDNTGYYDVSLVVNYLERDKTVTGPFESKTMKWDVINNSEEVEVMIEGEKFYNFLSSNLERNEALVRRIENVDLILISGGEEIRNYIEIGQANFGITSSQDIPTYTNLSEGRGLFSSKTSVIRENVDLTARTRDSIVNGAITAGLGFEF